MWPIIEIAIAPKSEADAARLHAALQDLGARDPALRAFVDPESGQTMLGGDDEQRLDAQIDALRHTYGVEADIGAPQVVYREVLGRAAVVTWTHRKHLGPTSAFAEVTILLEPREPGGGYEFESKVADGSAPDEYIRGVERGLALAKEAGLLAGLPVIDFKATLLAAKPHEIDSSVMAFEQGARAAFQELREKGAPRLAEPIMKIEVVTPEDYVGDVIGDLNARCGMILGTDQRGDDQVIFTMAPLANMFGYADQLCAFSDGRAHFTMRYDHYEAAPLRALMPPDDPRFPPAIGMRVA